VPRGVHDVLSMALGRVPRQSIDRPRDRDGGHDPPGRTPHGRGDSGNAGLAFPRALGVALLSHASEVGGCEPCTFEGGVHLIGLFPREKNLGRGSGTHGHRGSHGDRVSQPHATIGFRDTDAVLAMGTEELSRLARAIPEGIEYRLCGGDHPILAHRGGELQESPPEDEGSRRIARDEVMVFEREAQSVNRWAGQVGGRYEVGEGRRPLLEDPQDGRRLVDHPDSAAAFHVSTLNVHMVRRKHGGIHPALEE